MPQWIQIFNELPARFVLRFKYLISLAAASCWLSIALPRYTPGLSIANLSHGLPVLGSKRHRYKITFSSFLFIQREGDICCIRRLHTIQRAREFFAFFHSKKTWAPSLQASNKTKQDDAQLSQQESNKTRQDDAQLQGLF